MSMDEDLSSSTVNSSRNGIIFFERLQDETEEQIATQSSGVLNGLFGRFWKSDATVPVAIPPSSNCQNVAANGDNHQPSTISSSMATISSASATLSVNVDTTADGETRTPPTSTDMSTPAIARAKRTNSNLSNLDSLSTQSSDTNPETQSRKLTDKFTNLFKGNKTRLQDYNRSNFRQYWMPDSTGKECYQCEERFTTFRRRHHCRVCGQIFCSKCCNIHFPGSALGYLGDLRLCVYCAKMMSQYLSADELSTAWRKNSNDESATSASVGGLSLPRAFASDSSTASTVTQAYGDSGNDVPISMPHAPPIATVSAGNLMWTPSDLNNGGFNSPHLLRGQTSSIPSVPGTPKRSISSAAAALGNLPEAANRRASFSMAPPTNRLPAMLSVEELLVQSERNSSSGDSNERHLISSSALQEEDESGPDWLRGIDSGIQSLRDDALRVDSSASLPSVPSNRSIEGISRGTAAHQIVERSRETADDGSLTSEVLEANERMCFDENGEITTIEPSAIVISRHAPVDVDTNAAFAKTAERLLDYLFEREQVEDTRWKQLVLSLAERIAARIEIDVTRRDSMNILDYVHIKKLHVETEEPNAETVWGVVCSKNVQRMDVELAEPRAASVMIVAGSIEYERIQGKLSSIEPIVFQEAEYLAKQVDRILARRPTLLLVEGGVSRIAAELLNKHNVKLVVNVKSTVLQRVARCTGADILPSSDAQLIQQNIGCCPHFCQRTVPLANGSDKILLIFDKCPDNRNCSVILKGPNAVELKSIKRILQMMIQSEYSSRLEKEYLNLLGVRLAFSESPCQVCSQRLANINNTDKSSFEEALQKSVLSSSPFIDYEPPFLETPRGRTCSLLPYFKQPLYRFGTNEDFEEAKEDSKKGIEKQIQLTRAGKLPSEPREAFAKSSCVAPSDLTAAASFRALSGLFFRRRVTVAREEKEKVNKLQREEEEHSNGEKPKRQDVLDPFCHQRVAVLFGSFSPKSPNAPYFCVRPWVVSMQFYGDHDMTLGEFLTRFCFNKSYECPSSNCEVPMLDHSRKLVFGRVCIEVTTQTVVQSGEENNQQNSGPILTWYYCPSCKLSSNVMPMNAAVWHLSFGRYLDYLSNASYSTGHLINTATSSNSQQPQQCSHCFFHETTHFFSMNNFVTTFKISPVRPFHVQFSPILCTILPSRKPKQDYLNDLSRLSDLFESLAATAGERLQRVAEEHDEYVEKFHAELVALLAKIRAVVGEKKPFIESLAANEIEYLLSNDSLAIKSVEVRLQLREAIYELISAWNEQCGVLAAHMRALKNAKDETSPGTEMPEISIEKLDDPFPSYLHLGLRLRPRCGVTVRDIVDNRGNYKPDIGSIIAYALSMADYEESRRKQREAAGGEDVPLNLNSSSVNIENEASQAAEHIELEFQDTQASYYVKAYYGERFRLLRKLLFPEGEEAFIRSLAETQFWTPQGGKSGSFFYKTCDSRFVIKSMSNFEIRSFIKFAPNYFEYVKTAVTEHKLTTLCKVFGVFRIGYKNKTSSYKGDILVMEHLFHNHNVSQVYDLKGSLRNRYASTGKNTSDLVLLDENLVKDLWNQQLYVSPHSKAAINQAISNDSHFLSAQYVMDYSLLVGVDEKNGQLILGIVDYMRTYTLDKKLESWVKIVAIPGAHLPTILSPEMYCTRFSEAIDAYFPVSPDQWTGLGTAVTY